MTTQFKPKLRREAKMDLQGALAGAASGAIFAMLARTDIYPYKSCLNCLAFHEPTEICQRFKTRPPAKVIVHGCEWHEDTQDIPF